MASLYSNENFPFAVVEELRRLGHDVLTVQDTGKAGRAIDDPEVLRYAKDLGRAVITLNRRHFVRLHLAGAQHAGIITCTFDPDFPAQARRIDEAIRVVPDLAGQLIRVNRPPR